METILHCCSALLQNLVGSSGETQCLEWTTSRGKCRCSLSSSSNCFLYVSFFSISILSLLPFSILSLLPLHHLFWIICPPKIKTSSFIAFCFTNGTYFCILFHTMTYFFNNAFYKLVNTTSWCLNSNLSYPEDLMKQWLHRRAGSRKF